MVTREEMQTWGDRVFGGVFEELVRAWAELDKSYQPAKAEYDRQWRELNEERELLNAVWERREAVGQAIVLLAGGTRGDVTEANQAILRSLAEERGLLG